MTNLFAAAIVDHQPQDHFCMVCERTASFGFELRRMPARENGVVLPGDGFCGYVWYCREHRSIGGDLVKRERSSA